MLELKDARGVAIRVHDEAELAGLEQAMVGILGMAFDPLPLLQSRPAPCPMVLLTECLLRLTSMEERQLAHAGQLIAQVRAMALDEREAVHLAACRFWHEQSYEAAWECWDAWLSSEPCDALAVFGQHMLEFNMGWTRRMKDTITAVLLHWVPEMPLYGYIRGIEAFALVENGFHGPAAIAADSALSVNAKDIYAIHAACHVGYELGQYASTLQWLNRTHCNWADNLCMRIHLWWHHALFNLFMLRHEEVLATFHERIRVKNDPDGCEDLDAVSLLWRLSLAGQDVSGLWHEVAQHWMPSVDHSQYWFNDVHAIMAMVSSGHHVLVRRILRRLDTTYGKVPAVARVTRIVCTALVAFHQGDYQQSYDLLAEVLPAVSAIGGSNAQRDLLELTAIEAAIRAGRFTLARQLIENGRSLRHPSPLRDYFVCRLDVERVALH